ncbi:TPA: putative adhesin [Providencia alcalifaciens]
MSIKYIIIKSLNMNASKALLLSLGGYTPRRDRIRRGSGMICVPEGIHLFFNSEVDRPSIGTKAFHLLQGHVLGPVESMPPGSVINNYSLTYNKIFEKLKPTAEYDLITISLDGKAHLSDVLRR